MPTPLRPVLAAALLLSILGTASAQPQAQPPAASTPPSPAPAPAPTPASTATFPSSWLGRWSGQVAAGTGAQAPRFTMDLVIAPTEAPDRFTWTIIYDGDAGRQERPYTLVVRDAAKGLYAIDENNGIVLDARLLGGTLHTQFLVEGNRIATRYRLDSAGAPDAPPRIAFELLTFAEDKPSITGGKDNVPEVRSWAPVSIQTASLVRQADAGKTPAAAAPTTAPAPAGGLPPWTMFKTEPYPGKQDDVFFVSPSTGWYVNGAGKIFKTTDAGKTWTLQLHKPGTYFRCIAFINERVGLAGNIGPGYFPNVSDTVPLYRTEDGGETWSPVTAIDGPPVTGLCSLEVLREKFVNAGNLDERVRVYAAGRVGGPTALIFSDDLGKTWTQIDLKAAGAAMAFDVHFFDRDHGVLAAASDADVAQSNALILTTADGGKTWTKAYQSARPFELTWKISFPTRQVGYVTIQSYNPDPAAAERFVAKTTDGGKTWTEIPLVSDPKVRQFGVAFIDEDRGWIGAMPRGYQTTDGGKTWTPTNFGNAVNKIRLLSTDEGTHAFAVGVGVGTVFVPRK